MKRYLLSLIFISSFAAADQAPAETPATSPVDAIEQVAEQEIVKTLKEKLLALTKKGFGSSTHLVELGFGCYLAKLLHEDLKKAGQSVIGGWQLKLLFALAAGSFIKNSAEGLNDKLELHLGKKYDTLSALVKRKLGIKAN